MNVEAPTQYFIDTNILVYAYDRSAGEKHETAARVVMDCWEHGNGCLSTQILQEFYVTVTRKILTPIDYQTARQIVADLAKWRLQICDAGDVLQAIDLQVTHQLSFWDALIIESAQRLGCSQLLTEDLSHGQHFGSVLVVNPFRV